MAQRLRTTQQIAMERYGITPKEVESVEITKNPFNITRQRMAGAFQVLKTRGEHIDPAFEERVMSMDVAAERRFMVEGVGEVTGMRCQHLQIEGLVSKGGIRFEPELTPDKDRALAFSQTPKNLMAGLPYVGSKGGANINPGEMEEHQVRAVCHTWVNTFMDMIGPNIDVPAGDWGVGSREVNWMLEQYRDNLMAIARVAVNGGEVTLGTYRAMGPDMIEHDYELRYDQRKALEYFRRNVGLADGHVSPNSEILRRISEDADFAMLFARPAFTGKTVEMGGHPIRTGATGRGMFIQAMEAAKYLYREGRWRVAEGIKLSEEQERLLDIYVRMNLGEQVTREERRELAEKQEEMGKIERALFQNATLVVTGAGKVGLGVIEHFENLGCGVKLLAISDSRGATKNLEGGINVAEITQLKNAGGKVAQYPGGEATTQEDIMGIPCTIFASTTPEFAYIDQSTAPLIKAQLHLQGTNGPNTPAGDAILRANGVFDMDDIMNNAGGVTASGLEWARNLYAVAEYINPTLQRNIGTLGLKLRRGQVTDDSMYQALDTLMVKDFWQTLQTAIRYNTDLGTANRINTIHYLQSVM